MTDIESIEGTVTSSPNQNDWVYIKSGHRCRYHTIDPFFKGRLIVNGVERTPTKEYSIKEDDDGSNITMAAKC